jgi:probable HAF family extracellular repeat protein
MKANRGRPMSFSRAAIIGFFFGFASVAFCDPINYTYITISDPNASYGTYATGVNDSGQVVGYYGDANSNYQGFVYANGTFTTISDPNATAGTYVTGINDSGQMVGYYTAVTTTPIPDGFEETYVNYGFEYANGVYTTIDDPNSGTYGTWLDGINDSGQILGYYQDTSASFVNYGFVDTNGAFTVIADPNALSGPFIYKGPLDGTFVNGINDSGQIVGYYFLADRDTVGVEYSNAGFTNLIGPDGGEVFPTGINDSGEIVGTDDAGGFADINGNYITIADSNASSVVETFPTGVSNSGDVVGYYDEGGVIDGFVATPIAMPDGDASPLWMIPALLIVLMLARTWQKRRTRALPGS